MNRATTAAAISMMPEVMKASSKCAERRSVEHRRDAHHPARAPPAPTLTEGRRSKCDRRRREQVGKAIGKSLSQSPRRYPLSNFFVNVNRFTLVVADGLG